MSRVACRLIDLYSMTCKYSLPLFDLSKCFFFVSSLISKLSVKKNLFKNPVILNIHKLALPLFLFSFVYLFVFYTSNNLINSSLIFSHLIPQLMLSFFSFAYFLICFKSIIQFYCHTIKFFIISFSHENKLLIKKLTEKVSTIFSFSFLLFSQLTFYSSLIIPL